MSLERDRIFVKSVTLKNVRCFGRSEKIDFTGQDEMPSNWNVILGNNGTGKTTILKAISGVLPHPSDFLKRRSHLDTEYQPSLEGEFRNTWNIQRTPGDNDAEILLELALFSADVEEPISFPIVYSENQEHQRASGGNKFDTKLLPPIYCFAYGANRKTGTKSLTGDNLLEASSTLFDEEALLPNSEEFFLQVDYDAAKRKKKSEKNKIETLILKILPDGIKGIRVNKSGILQREVQALTNYGWVRLSDLSLGYKTSLAWLIDFATKMIVYYPNSHDPFREPAILLIDEIDLHMHPSWQREIIQNLTDIFPNTQFIVTAHSPLIAQAAIETNIVLLKRVKDQVTVDNDPIAVRNWRVDQILTSDLFGIRSSRGKQYDAKMTRRRNLLSKTETLSEKEKIELNRLNTEVSGMPIGDNPQETDTYELLREFALKLAELRNKNGENSND